MATTKKSSTSKTARVMNLLSKNREEESTQEIAPASEAAQPAPVNTPTTEPVAPASTDALANTNAPASAPHSTTPPIISSMQADSAISDQVFSALENALGDELGQSVQTAAIPEPVFEPTPAPTATAESAPAAAAEPAPAPAPAAAAEPAPAPAPAAAAEPAPAPAPAAAAEPAPAPAPAAAAEPAPAPASTSIYDVKPDPALHPPTLYPVSDATIYVNVMEALVEDKAMKYINMFGLCKCSRCVADVKSLALNRLDPKYVVMHAGEVIPRISLYEGQFSAAVTAQLLSACKIVMEHPRHDRQ